MAKGFGPQPDQQLGYILNLMPAAHAYAGKFSLDFRGEEGPFIGIVNQLQEAQTWKTIKHSKQAITNYYADFLMD